MPFRRTLAFRTVAGVVALLAVVLALMGMVIMAVAGRTLDAQLDTAVRQAMERSAAFTGGDGAVDVGPTANATDGATPPPDTSTPTKGGSDLDRDPLEAPGQPVGVLSVDVVDGTVKKATYLSPRATAEALPQSDIDALTELGLATGDKAVAPGDADQAGLEGVDLSLGHYRVGAVGPLPDAGNVPGQPKAQAPGPQRFVLTGLPSEQVEHTKEALLATVVGGSLGTLLVTALLGLWWVRRSLRPLAEVSRSAVEVAALPLESGQVPVREHQVRGDLAQPGTEVGDVGHALNLLLTNVDEALRARNASEAQLRQFVADASHELRTPLASVRGYADMLRLSEQLTPQGMTSLQRLLTQARRMGGLVDDMLLLARLDAGRAPEAEPVDLGEIVAEAVMDAAAAGPEHRWDLEVPEQPVTVSGDTVQLAQVVGNLLSNARKHTPEGTTVRTALSSRGDQAVLTVDDDGPGIPSSLKEHLFGRFARGDAARSDGDRVERSTGLGLAIVRTVAEAHGGQAAVESPRPGADGGTRFTVRLPLEGQREAR